MTKAQFRGQITALNIKNELMKLTIEADINPDSLVTLLQLLDKGVGIEIRDNQTQISEFTEKKTQKADATGLETREPETQ